jgi:uncharacterized integral membrane protein
MALLHRDKTEERADTRPGDERLMEDRTVAGPATVDRDVDRDGVDDRVETRDHDRDRTVVRDEREVVRPSRWSTFGLIVRTIIFTLAVVAITVVATQNLDDVNVDMVFEEYTTPMWVVMVLSAAVGCIAGLMVRSGRRTTVRRESV